MAPKRSKKCPGCHLDVALHKSGVAGKDCTGILEDNGAVGQGMQGAMAELQQRKAELTQRLELKKLQREVDALEKELATDTTTTSPLPPAKDGSKTDETQDDERKHVDFGLADITLAQLREDAALQSLVSTKYGDLVGAGKKPEKESNRSDLVREGALKVFNDLLLDDDTEIQYYCAAALSNMAVDTEHRRIMGNLWERNIPGRLIALLSSMADKVKCQACLALRNLASDETNQRLIVRQGALPKLYHLLKTGSKDTQVAAVACVRNLSICKANQEELLQDWFLAILPRMLRDKSTAVRCHAAGTVRNLVDTENAEAFVQAGILDALTENLVDSSSSVDLQSEVTAAVAIMANKESVRDHLHQTREGRVFPNLVSVATNCENLNVQYNCASIIGQLLVTGIEAETIEPNVPGLLCYLERLLNSGDANAIQISLWSLLLLAKYANFQRVYPSSALPQKVESLLWSNLPANIQEMARSVVNKYATS